MPYALDITHDSPNYGGFTQTIALPATLAVVHWWGAPSGQDPAGIIAHLCNPAAQVSAHEVVWPGNVAVLVNHDQPSWANGNTWANTHAITFECDPTHVAATIDTLVERLADLVRAGDLAPGFELHGHRDYYNTACPGDYYPQLAAIRQRVTDNLNGTTTTTQEEDIMASIDDLRNLLINDTDVKHALAVAIWGGGGAASPMYTDRIDGHQEYPETALFSLRQRLASQLGAISGQISGLGAAVAQLAQGQDIDLDAVKNAATDGAKAGIQAMIDTATITLEATK